VAWVESFGAKTHKPCKSVFESEKKPQKIIPRYFDCLEKMSGNRAQVVFIPQEAEVGPPPATGGGSGGGAK
jgi:hypothetical protein